LLTLFRWGTRWRGIFDLRAQKCHIGEAPNHPHVFKDKLCVHDLPDDQLLTWVNALITVWHVTDWDDAYNLRGCVDTMIEGLDRQEIEPDLLAQYKWIKRALAHCSSGDERIGEYRELIRDLQDARDLE
jgi:hypothetical protein